MSLLFIAIERYRLIYITVLSGRDRHSLDCKGLNARSRRNKLPDMLVSLTLLPLQIHVSTTQCSIMKSCLLDIQFSGTDSVDRRGHVVLMAYKSDITVWTRNDLEPDCELLWCEFTSSASEKILFGTYYRPQILGLSISNCFANLSLLLITNSIRYFWLLISICPLLIGLTIVSRGTSTNCGLTKYVFPQRLWLRFH